MKELSTCPLKQFSCPRFLLEDRFPIHWVNSFFIQCAEQIELGASKEEPPTADCNPNYICATHHPKPRPHYLILGGGPLMPYWFFLVTGLATLWSYLILGTGSFILLLSCQFQLVLCLWHHFYQKVYTLTSPCALGLQLVDFPVQSKVINPNNSQDWELFECITFKQALHVIF